MSYPEEVIRMKALLSTMVAIFMLFIAVQAQAAQGFPYVPDEHTILLLHLDEGSGEEIIDSSKNSFNGVVEGNAKWDGEEWKKEGPSFGESFVFDGQTCVSFEKPSEILSPDCEDAMTVEVWVYPEQLSGWNLILTCWGSSRDGGPLHLASDAGRPDIIIDTGTDGAMDPQGWMKITSPKPFELNEWQHVAATYDSEEGGKLYVNGELVGEQKHEGEIWVSGGEERDLVLGARHERSLKWIGQLDEVRISSVAREPEELSPNLKGPEAVSPIGNLVITWGRIKSR